MIRILKSSFYAAAIPGIFMAIIATVAAWGHNPSLVYHHDGYIDWAGLILVGGGWFVFVTAIVFIMFLSFSVLAALAGKKLINQNS
jgi:hypothetical protein